MSARDGLFRQAALERLSSPEQLDRLVVITDTRAWLALATVGALLLAIVLWGVFGRVPYDVEGEGMIISEGGRVYNAMAPAEGVVERIDVRPNQRVRRGELLVVLRQDGLRAELADASARLRDQESERIRLVERHEADLEVRGANFEKQRRAQREIIVIAEARRTYFEDFLARGDELLATGVVSRRALESTREEYNRVVQSITDAENRILELDARLLDLRAVHVDRLTAADRTIAESRRRVAELEARLTRLSRVEAPASGTVTEVRAAEEAVVQAGAPLVSIASDADALQVVLYVPTSEGKKLRTGMTARVAPATVRKEEYGTLLGRVAEISEFPVTREGMASVLQNSTLVERFSARGAPYMARIDLTTDPGTPSGYAWTSALGPDQGISAGTTARAEITVREIPPIVLLMPFLQTFFE
jgi:HlyD family secretion protein